jgi:2-polyprenyl-3-methyl-5-hydroxy-6-metoxy-1,4-benzoquinol methylase
MPDHRDHADHMAANRLNWDSRVPIHVASQFYEVAAFKEGRSSLLPAEIAEVGDVHGKTLLHLQCHFGLDTLSWARAGALVTGVDFSSAAISAARELAADLRIEARFIESNVYDLRATLSDIFDVVFSSYGVWCAARPPRMGADRRQLCQAWRLLLHH